MFTPEELRQAKIFACLDEAECARVAQNAADIRLQPGEWLVRSGETAWFYVLYEGRIVAEVDRDSHPEPVPAGVTDPDCPAVSVAFWIDRPVSNRRRTRPTQQLRKLLRTHSPPR
jgi:hypothetical protein